MQDIIIFGAGGLAREINYLINRYLSEEFNVIGFAVEDKQHDLSIQRIGDLPVYRKEFLYEHEVGVVIGFSSASDKARLCKELSKYKNLSYPSIITPSNVISPDSRIGQGVVMTDGCSVSVNTTVDDFVLMNGGVGIGHDAVIGKYSSIMPRCSVSGNVAIGEACTIGAHSFILQGKHVGDNSVIAAGSIVFTNVPANVTAMGNPASILFRHKEHK